MTNNQTDFRALCAEVLAFNNGESPYNFSGLTPYDRDIAAFDAWQDIRQRLKSALRLAQTEPTLTVEDCSNSMTESRLVLLLAWKIAEILSKSRPGDDCTPFAQDVILEVAAWLRKRNVRVRASVEIAGDLEREIRAFRR